MEDNVVQNIQSEDSTRDQASSMDSANAADNNVSGSQGKRLKLFNKAMEKSLQRLIADASFHRFAQSFHPFYKDNPQTTKQIHHQFIASLQEHIQKDISRVIEECELQCKLEELDRLCDAAKDNTETAWRPSGLPEQDISSFLMPYYRKQELVMRRKLEKLTKENEELARTVQEGRSAIANAEQLIAAEVEKWKAPVEQLRSCISTLCPEDSFDEL